MTPNIEELITRLKRRYSDTKKMLPCDLEHSAASALQSQAERIAELEADRNLEKKMRKDADEYAEQLREKYNDTYGALDDAARENTSLRAQLAEIAATEPVAHQFQTLENRKWHDFLDDKHYQNTKDDGRWPIRELFTRPMPAKDVTELVKDAERWRFTMWWQDQNPRPESIQNCLTDMHRWARARGALGPNSEELQRAVDAALSKYKVAK
jgi:hypothetical protein